MTLEELKDIFKLQTTASGTFKPNGWLEYWMFSGQDRVHAKVKVEDLEEHVFPALKEYQFDGYRDRTPLFIKPEVHVLL